MQYQGGKHRFAKPFSKIINAIITDESYYLEPFLGGCNILPHIHHPKRFGSDIRSDVIHFWAKVRDGWLPPEEVSKEEYYHYKSIRETLRPELRAYISIGCSYSGKLWGGYANTYKSGRNRTKEVYNNVKRRVLNKSDIFFTAPYIAIKPKNAIIYCDPPYAGTTDYKTKFDHLQFWETMRDWSIDNIVLISEYNAPSDFISIWSKQTTNQIGSDKTYRTENLFILGDSYGYKRFIPNTLF